VAMRPWAAVSVPTNWPSARVRAPKKPSKAFGRGL
jgi:hypothetical protein